MAPQDTRGLAMNRAERVSQRKSCSGLSGGDALAGGVIPSSLGVPGSEKRAMVIETHEPKFRRAAIEKLRLNGSLTAHDISGSSKKYPGRKSTAGSGGLEMTEEVGRDACLTGVPFR